MTVDELSEWLQEHADRVRPAVADAANAMGQQFQRDVVQSMHGPSPSPPGTPPARRSGTLARSVRATKAVVSGFRATVQVAPHTVYARIQNNGGVIHVVRAKVLTDGKTFFGKQVTLPARPYMNVTSQRADAAERAGRDAFKRTMGW